MITRAPIAPLRPFVARVWATGTLTRSGHEGHRERVLPTGCAHLVFRPDASPLRLFDARTDALVTVSRCVLAGPRTVHYERAVSPNTPSVGAVLRPATGAALLGVSCTEIVDMHVDARLVLGQPADELCERLSEANSAEAQLALLEAFLLARIDERAIAPRWVRAAVASLDATRPGSIAAIVDATGASHRYFSTVFCAHTGMTPKRFARVRRFDATVTALSQGDRSLAQIAADLGYADQAHLSREFVAHASLTPGQHRAASPTDARHVALGQISSRPSRDRAR
jgi:AraC-like DNA-binding protein